MSLRILRLFKRFRNSQSGAVAALEFCLGIPAFLWLFMASFESAMLMTRFVMMERSVDLAMRELRLGHLPGITHDGLKDEICRNTVIYPNCKTELMLELRPVSKTTWEPLGNAATCVDRGAAIQPVTEFNPGAPNEMMLVRACAVFDPIFPGAAIGMRLPKDSSGGYRLIASSAFVNEPN